jgi:hypothetical protein
VSNGNDVAHLDEALGGYLSQRRGDAAKDNGFLCIDVFAVSPWKSLSACTFAKRGQTNLFFSAPPRRCERILFDHGRFDLQVTSEIFSRRHSAHGEEVHDIRIFYQFSFSPRCVAVSL